MPSMRESDSKLDRIKDTVRKSYDYFRHNYDRYNEFRRFVFDSSLSHEEITLLQTISKPQLEFNICEAYISRLLGEFSKQEPDIAVNADDQNTADPLTIKVVEQHLRHELLDMKNEHTRYEVYKDLLSGGFSTLKLYTEYANSSSFNQVICIERVEPTLCGFDHITKTSHKGDGRFCFQLFPMSVDDFKEQHPDIKTDDMSFSRDFAGFNWSYLDVKTPIIMICDYYEKRKVKYKLVMLSDNRVMSMSKYNKMLREWGDLAVPPSIVSKRMTEKDVITRTRLVQNQIMEEVETDFEMLPLVFVDGNSALLKTPKNGNIRQFTRPYIYHAKGAQRLKNYAGISMANEIENIIQHKFIIMKEALPKEDEWLAAIKDPQKPSNIVVNAFYEENPDQQIPNPIREVVKTPAPPEILQAFTGTDSAVQQILGSYDAALGINDNQLSGIAVVEAASQSNSAAMPYIVGFMQGLQRVAEIYVNLLPKYFTTPRTIPIMDEEGKRSFIKINQDQGINMFYDSNALNVVVKAGASFQVQKSKTLMMVKEIMGMSPLFAQFIADKGLSFVLDNLEGRGIEQLKKMVEEWQQEMAQQKAQAMQMQQQEMMNNPAVLKAKNDQAKLALDAVKSERELQQNMAKLQHEQNKSLMDALINNKNNMVQIYKADTERFAKIADIMTKHQGNILKHSKGAH